MNECPQKDKALVHQERSTEVAQKLHDPAYIDGAIDRLASVLSKKILALQGIDYE